VDELLNVHELLDVHELLNVDELLDVHVVVRHVSERTTGLCGQIIAKQVPRKNISFVSAEPFVETLRLAYDAGIAANKKWTLCFDADVIPTTDSVSKMVQFAEEHEDRIFLASGLIIDRTFGNIRQAGNHIYRTKHLPNAYQFLGEAEKRIRPESTVNRLMFTRYGLSRWIDETIVGLHDFGQYHHDVARTIFVQMFKFKAQRAELYARFKQGAARGQHFDIVALNAGIYALEKFKSMSLDAGKLREHAVEVVRRSGLEEKTPMAQKEAMHLVRALEKYGTSENPFKGFNMNAPKGYQAK